jgi:hypothetical protein
LEEPVPFRGPVFFMRLHTHIINAELKRLGHTAVLTKGNSCFYFESGEAANWIDRTVGVRTINSLTLKQWIEEFRRLKELNEQILSTGQRQP